MNKKHDDQDVKDLEEMLENVKSDKDNEEMIEQLQAEIKKLQSQLAENHPWKQNLCIKIYL